MGKTNERPRATNTTRQARLGTLLTQTLSPCSPPPLLHQEAPTCCVFTQADARTLLVQEQRLHQQHQQEQDLELERDWQRGREGGTSMVSFLLGSHALPLTSKNNPLQLQQLRKTREKQRKMPPLRSAATVAAAAT